MINGGQLDQSGPLSGYRVLDFGWVLAGAIPGMVLADMGAEVIKVETRQRLDYMRQGRPIIGTERDPEQHPMFHNVNRSKLSVTLNLDLRWNIEKTTALLGVPFAGKASFSDMHDRKMPVTKPKGTYRIIALGTSSTFGVGLANPEKGNYPTQLLHRLNNQGGQTRPVEVFNAGIAGAPFSVIQIYLRDVLVGLKPDLVVLYFGNNGDNPETLNTYQAIKAKTHRWPHLRSNDDIWVAMQLRHSPRWLVDAFSSLAESPLFLLSMWAGKETRLSVARLRGIPLPVQQQPEYPLPVLARPVRAVVQACVARGIKVLLIPEVTIDDIRVSGDISKIQSPYRKIFRALAHEFRGRGVFFSDILGAFGLEHVDRFMVDAVHFNKEGYRYLARQIEEAMRAHQLVPGMSPPASEPPVPKMAP